MIQGKVWGTTENIFSDGATVSAHALRIMQGAYCSIHKHTHKDNIFYVIGGKLEIAQWPCGKADDEGQPDVTILGPGQSTSVEAGNWHRFRAVSDVLCIEICYGKLIGEDIMRRSTGGAF